MALAKGQTTPASSIVRTASGEVERSHGTLRSLMVFVRDGISDSECDPFGMFGNAEHYD